MGSKKCDVYTLRSAFNEASVQVDRELDMNKVRKILQDTADELDYWDSWHNKQVKSYKGKKEEVKDDDK